MMGTARCTQRVRLLTLLYWELELPGCEFAMKQADPRGMQMSCVIDSPRTWKSIVQGHAGSYGEVNAYQ